MVDYPDGVTLRIACLRFIRGLPSDAKCVCVERCLRNEAIGEGYAKNAWTSCQSYP